MQISSFQNIQHKPANANHVARPAFFGASQTTRPVPPNLTQRYDTDHNVLIDVLKQMGLTGQGAKWIKSQLTADDTVMAAGIVPGDEQNKLFILIKNNKDPKKNRVFWGVPSNLKVRKRVLIDYRDDGIYFFTMPNQWRQQYKAEGQDIPLNIKISIDPETKQIDPTVGLTAFESRWWPERQICRFALFAPDRVTVWQESPKTANLILESDAWMRDSARATWPGKRGQKCWKKINPDEEQPKATEKTRELIDAFA